MHTLTGGGGERGGENELRFPVPPVDVRFINTVSRGCAALVAAVRRIGHAAPRQLQAAAPPLSRGCAPPPHGAHRRSWRARRRRQPLSQQRRHHCFVAVARRALERSRGGEPGLRPRVRRMPRHARHANAQLQPGAAECFVHARQPRHLHARQLRAHRLEQRERQPRRHAMQQQRQFCEFAVRVRRVLRATLAARDTRVTVSAELHCNFPPHKRAAPPWHPAGGRGGCGGAADGRVSLAVPPFWREATVFVAAAAESAREYRLRARSQHARDATRRSKADIG